MQQDIEKSLVQFHNRSRTIFFSLYNDLRLCSKQINRQHYENHFQQWQAQYITQLRQHLQQIAKETIEDASTAAHRNELGHTLQQSMEAYVQDFIKKMNDL
jgi:hypothetical protein